MTSDVNSTLIAELKIYECCDANATYATGDYSSGYDDEDYEDDVMTPGRCCVKEPMPVWLAILILVILALILAGCCFLCCFIRPKLEGLCNQYQRPHISHDTIQTVAALKILTSDIGGGGGGQNSNPFGGQPNWGPGQTIPPPPPPMTQSVHPNQPPPPPGYAPNHYNPNMAAHPPLQQGYQYTPGYTPTNQSAAPGQYPGAYNNYPPNPNPYPPSGGQSYNQPHQNSQQQSLPYPVSDSGGYQQYPSMPEAPPYPESKTTSLA
ncbi:trithorax group protein osa-like [Symsagittifera roscoffensis]|uniref:trithorax group protein osa-like n=1 Tax=Symsagittifera roscoffensis TaxID=84072 RepID=UPI00307B8276